MHRAKRARRTHMATRAGTQRRTDRHIQRGSENAHAKLARGTDREPHDTNDRRASRCLSSRSNRRSECALQDTHFKPPTGPLHVNWRPARNIWSSLLQCQPCRNHRKCPVTALSSTDGNRITETAFRICGTEASLGSSGPAQDALAHWRPTESRRPARRRMPTMAHFEDVRATFWMDGTSYGVQPPLTDEIIRERSVCLMSPSRLLWLTCSERRTGAW